MLLACPEANSIWTLLAKVLSSSSLNPLRIHGFMALSEENDRRESLDITEHFCNAQSPVFKQAHLMF